MTAPPVFDSPTMGGPAAVHALCDEEAEIAVLSALLMDDTAIPRVRALLHADDFFRPAHRRIYNAIIALVDRGTAADLLTVSRELDRGGELQAVGGKEYLAFLIDAVPTAANVEYHARLVLDIAQRRCLVSALEASALRLRERRQTPLEVVEQLAPALETLRAPAGDQRLLPAACALQASASDPISWVIEDLWTKGDIGLLVGDGGAFKSSAALHMAAAIAGGYPVFDQFAAERRPALIISAEDPEAVILMRLDAFIAGHGWDRTRVLENVHYFAQTETSLSDPRWQAHLILEARRLDVGFIVLDPLAELLEGDENSNTDVRPVIKFVRLLAQQTAAAVAIVHHAGKASQDKRTYDRIRGASALPSAARVILFFEFRSDGVRVENLKMSRAQRLEPFMVQREIQHQPGNRAMWTSARLGYETARQFVRTRAEDFVLTQLRTAHPSRMGSGELRRSARECSGVRNEEINTALKTLTARSLIDWVAGPRSSKLWGLTQLSLGQNAHPAQSSWAGSKSDPAHPAHTLPGQGAEARLNPARPFRGGAGSTAAAEPWSGSTRHAAPAGPSGSMSPEENREEIRDLVAGGPGTTPPRDCAPLSI